MERYKVEILTVQGFLEERPDMEVHTDKTIQSAIYQVAGLLNAKTGGLIQKVWDYSVVDRTNNGSDNGFTQPDPNGVYYRTPEQLDFIKQAFVEQTQYNINLGNDYTQGGGSYSMGNVNASFSRPENRDIFAPMVEYLLQQARVLDLQDFLVETNNTIPTNTSGSPTYDYDCKCLSENYANLTYLKKYQPDADVGRVATINNAHIITFEPVQQVFDDAGGLKAKEVWDPVKQVYKQINQFDISYWNGLTKQQIYNAIYDSGIVWNEHIPYQQDWVVMFQLNDGSGIYKYAKSLIDNNLGNNPNNSPNFWEILPVSPTDMNVIYNYIDNKINQLPQINYISEANGEVLTFNSQSDYETYKTTMGVDDSYFQDINDNVAYINQSNSFTKNQYFYGDIAIEHNSANNKSALILNGGDIFLNGGTINNVPDPIVDGNAVNLKYFKDNAKTPLNEVKTSLTTLETKLTNLTGTTQSYQLRSVYASSQSKTYNANGGIFYTIYTNLTLNPYWTYQIRTSGDIGNPNGPNWYSTLQISSYVNANGNLVICINKTYDSANDLEYWKDNIYIYVWKNGV